MQSLLSALEIVWNNQFEPITKPGQLFSALGWLWTVASTCKSGQSFAACKLRCVLHRLKLKRITQIGLPAARCAALQTSKVLKSDFDYGMGVVVAARQRRLDELLRSQFDVFCANLEREKQGLASRKLCKAFIMFRALAHARCNSCRCRMPTVAFVPKQCVNYILCHSTKYMCISCVVTHMSMIQMQTSMVPKLTSMDALLSIIAHKLIRMRLTSNNERYCLVWNQWVQPRCTILQYPTATNVAFINTVSRRAFGAASALTRCDEVPNTSEERFFVAHGMTPYQAKLMRYFWDQGPPPPPSKRARL